MTNSNLYHSSIEKEIEAQDKGTRPNAEFLLCILMRQIAKHTNTPTTMIPQSITRCIRPSRFFIQFVADYLVFMLYHE